MKNLKIFTPALITIGGVFLILLSFALVITSEFEKEFLNSDCMYLPSIYRDIFIHKNNMELWSFNAAPNVFPDMILYFLILSITGNIVQAGIAYAVVQYILIAVLSDYIIRKLYSENNLSGRIFLQILLLLPHTFTLYPNHFLLHFQYLSNAYHLGAMLNTLIAWSIVLNIEEIKKTSTKYIAFFALCILLYVMSVSDKLFWLLFLAPLFGYYILKFWKEKERTPLIHALSLLLTFVLSSWTLNGLRSSKPKIDAPFRNMSTEYIGESFSIFLEHMRIELTGLTVKSLFVGLIALSIIILSFQSTRIFIRFFQKKSISPSSLWSVFILASVILGIIAPIMNGSYSAFDCIRYNFPAMILALIALAIIATPKIQRIPWLVLAAPFFILSAYWGNKLTVHKEDLVSKLNLVPEETRVIENAVKSNGLHAGIAPYWSAKKNELFNTSGIKIVPVLGGCCMYIHANNRQWYLTEHGNDNKQYFDFAIARTPQEIEEYNSVFGKDLPYIEPMPGLYILKTGSLYFDNITERITVKP